MLFGASKKVVTPFAPLRLAGYASRKEAFRKVEEDIYVRVHVQRTAEAQLVFIYGDFLWWNTQFVDTARVRLKKELGLHCDDLFFVASHNHSGPGTGNSFVPQLEQAEESYRDFLLKKVVEAVKEALEVLDEVTVWRFDGNSDLNVFRRMKLG
ncbi:MAG: alkaline ceramidase, partial [Acetatifactor sp.]|nr:alkaline ceramidase [Acetatifactor sp.]